MRSLAAFAAFAMFGGTGGAACAATARIVVPSVGGTPWAVGGVAKLRADLDAMLDASPIVRGAHVGVVALDTATGTVLYERHADEEFQVASALKLVVGSVALDRLGPNYSPATSVRTADGALDIFPGGDPFFGLGDVDAIATFLVHAGVRTLSDVVVVNGWDDEPAEHPDGWTYDDFAQYYAPPISRATFEENVIHVHVTPGALGGSPTSVTTTPSIGALASGEADCSRSGAFVVDEATTGAPESENSLDVRSAANGCRVLYGRLALGAPVSDIDVAVPEPRLYLARSIAAALRTRGVTVAGNGDVRPMQWPVPTRTGDGTLIRGIPLNQVMPRFWIPSDNFVGETLLLHLAPSYFPSGAPSPGEGNSYALDARVRALDVERDWLRSIGVDPSTTTLADGSGLSQYDRITPRDLVTILEHDWNGPNRQIVLDSLPVGGARGTIEGIDGTPAAGRVFAKTGSMMHVRGLAGYLATERHGAVTVAFDVDDWIGDYAALAALRASVLARIIAD